MKIKYKFIILAITITFSIYAQSWTPLGSGLNDKSRVLLNDTVNNKLIVGGDFTYAGGQSAPFIASWDGVNWQNIGLGFNAPVYALAIYNNELYAGGSFTLSGTDTVKYLAKWNGIKWVSVGNGVTNNNVKFLKTYQGKLYISGDFTALGNINKRNITWNGTAFDSIAGFPHPGPISDIAFYKYKTYFACGIFVVSYNGFSYQSFVSNGVNTGGYISVKSLEVHQNLLYLAGYNTGSSQYCADIFDGNSLLGYYMFNAHYPTNGPINVIKVVNNDIYMGGIFTDANYGAIGSGVTVNNITKYTPSSQTFYAVNYGTDNEIFDIELFNNSLYIAGNFVYSGSSLTNFIAKLPCAIQPTVSIASFSTICFDAQDFQLSGGLPTGGIYSGAGVNSGTFNPTSAGLGTHPISYNYTDSYTGCSNTVSTSIVVSSCLGVNEYTTNSSIIISPNPSNTQWNLFFPIEPKSIELLNANGKLVWETNKISTSSLVIPCYDFASGIYILKTIINEKIGYQKLIKE